MPFQTRLLREAMRHGRAIADGLGHSLDKGDCLSHDKFVAVCLDCGAMLIVERYSHGRFGWFGSTIQRSCAAIQRSKARRRAKVIQP